ncbi:probable caffeine synthase 4 [Amaranthus tricolor]|uniref:probable caffeine synthase 4 n=1 Tax=Amaranthus tricolor TaxID=29722 RepID=UPI002587AEE1|nr:probable caffeine synthase 4 [Amaranthus tricolor]
MELEHFFHMNEGDGEHSYSQNSSAQERAWQMNKSTLEYAIQSLLSKGGVSFDNGVINAADLGCGVGPVPLAFVSLVIHSLQKKLKELKWKNDDKITQLQIYMNDLPSNDFKWLFRNLFNLDLLKTRNQSGPLCFLFAAPGSYYQRLFPDNSLHLVHANYTLHWFSKVPKVLSSEERSPINKGQVYISEASSELVARSYLKQFEQDFTQFLECRSQEMVIQGRMLLTFRGRPSSSYFFTWQPWELQIFTTTLHSLIAEGLIKKEKVDSFNFPYYCGCEKDFESIIKKQGSFEIEKMKTISHHVEHKIEDKWEKSKRIANFIRAFSQSLISLHFGEHIVNPLYDKLCHFTFKYLEDGLPCEHFTVTILLYKN